MSFSSLQLETHYAILLSVLNTKYSCMNFFRTPYPIRVDVSFSTKALCFKGELNNAGNEINLVGWLYIKEINH